MAIKFTLSDHFDRQWYDRISIYCDEKSSLFLHFSFLSLDQLNYNTSSPNRYFFISRLMQSIEEKVSWKKVPPHRYNFLLVPWNVHRRHQYHDRIKRNVIRWKEEKDSRGTAREEIFKRNKSREMAFNINSGQATMQMIKKNNNLQFKTQSRDSFLLDPPCWFCSFIPSSEERSQIAGRLAR